MKTVFLFLFIAFSLSSCIEIVDDLTLNADGSGSYKYTINLSASKVKLNSYLALDSLDGKKVPSQEELINKINDFALALEKKNGMSNVQIETDLENYILKLSCDFKSVRLLQEAITNCIQEEMKEEKIALDKDENWLTWTEESFIRSIPDFTIKKTKELKTEEINLLKQGSYISITRFNRIVKNCSNENALIAKNKMAVMLKTNAYSLSQNLNLLENTIYLSPLKP